MTRLAIPKVVFQVEARQRQRLTVAVDGPDVIWLDESGDSAGAPGEEAVPDLVERWAQAMRCGLFGGRHWQPAAADVISRTRESAARLSWQIEVDGLEWGALRVLLNLLQARQLDEIALSSVPTRGGMPPSGWLSLDSLTFPRLPPPLPFQLERSEIVTASQLRAAKLSFACPLSDLAVDAMVKVLDLWAELITWGGYAPPGSDPRDSGALPDGAIWYDERTVAQGFSVAFYCDEAAFEAVLSYGLALRAQGLPLVQVSIQ